MRNIVKILKGIIFFLLGKHNLPKLPKEILQPESNSNNLSKGDKMKTSEPFKSSLKLILKYEGGFVNHPEDPGGATNKGITQKVYDNYRKGKLLNTRSVENISDTEIEKIYYTQYWVSGKCHKMKPKIAAIHFDSCVNTGIKQSAKFIQRAVGATDDGIIGPLTLKAVDDADEKEVIDSYLQQRRDFYRYLADKKNLNVFLTGWLNRVNHLEEHVNSNIV